MGVADFNGDGRADLAVASSGSLTVLFGNGDGTFHPPVNPASDLFLSAYSVPVGDFNDDGKPDLVSYGDRGLSVLFGNGDGTFHPVVTYGAAAGNAPLMAVGDFNGDSHPDLAVADGINVSVHLNSCIAAGPELAVVNSGSTVKVSWPFPIAEFVLESATSLAQPNWQPAIEVPKTNNARLEVTAPLNSPQRYFRLHKP